MRASELLAHLEQGGKIRFLGEAKQNIILSMRDIQAWDYDCVRNPNSYEIIDRTKDLGELIVTVPGLKFRLDEIDGLG